MTKSNLFLSPIFWCKRSPKTSGPLLCWRTVLTLSGYGFYISETVVHVLLEDKLGSVILRACSGFRFHKFAAAIVVCLRIVFWTLPQSWDLLVHGRWRISLQSWFADFSSTATSCPFAIVKSEVIAAFLCRGDTISKHLVLGCISMQSWFAGFSSTCTCPFTILKSQVIVAFLRRGDITSWHPVLWLKSRLTTGTGELG